MGNNGTGKKPNAYDAAADLTQMIERIERLKLDIKDLNEEIKDEFNAAKSKGFDAGTMRDVMKLRKMDSNDRKAKLAMIEVYLHALGMGDGSLSDMAREFLNERSNPDAAPEPDVQQDVPEFMPKGPAVPDAEGDQGADAPPAPPPLTIDDARKLGADAHMNGRPVTANPFPPGDPRRAAWDEEWCRASGTDGMEIPDFLKSAAALEADAKARAQRQKDEAEAAARREREATAEAAKSAEIDLEAAKHLDAARTHVLRTQKGSTSALQKALQIGYNMAARLVEALESEGILSKPDLQGRREVLFDENGEAKGGDNG